MNFPTLNIQTECSPQVVDHKTGELVEIAIADGQLTVTPTESRLPMPVITTHSCDKPPDVPGDHPNDDTTVTVECPEGSTGTPVSKTIPAGTYFSRESVAKANEQAVAAATEQAQAELVCTWCNQQITVLCPDGTTGGPVTVPAGNYCVDKPGTESGQAEADALARAIAEARLNCANTTLACSRSMFVNNPTPMHPSLYAPGASISVGGQTFIDLTADYTGKILCLAHAMDFGTDSSVSLCSVEFPLMRAKGTIGSVSAILYSAQYISGTWIPGRLLAEGNSSSIAGVQELLPGTVPTRLVLPLEYLVESSQRYFIGLHYTGYDPALPEDPDVTMTVYWCGAATGIGAEIQYWRMYDISSHSHLATDQWYGNLLPSHILGLVIVARQ